MTGHTADILVVGSGFAGSLMAMILARLGFSCLVVDAAEHPRFAVGESSTPIADMVLQDLARRYALPQLLPLCHYGTWRETYPELNCGLKRGFSYFWHEEHRPFLVRPDHGNELLVSASADTRHGDTHWLRADVDAFLADQARDVGVLLFENTHISSVCRQDSGWQLLGRRGADDVVLRCQFLIDASGGGQVLPRHFDLLDSSAQWHTNSRALFTHFRGVRLWDELLDTYEDHPFRSDHSAQHHLLDGAWMWNLRFEDDLVSAGLVFDNTRHPGPTREPDGAVWRSWLGRYPTLEQQFRSARLADAPGRFIASQRLQRRVRRAIGDGWALLPHTAGFVDPLYSTGIAHTLCGIERLASVFAQHGLSEGLALGLRGYEDVLFRELALIDELVGGAYQTLSCFRMFVAQSMLYFAAATTYEQRRFEGQGELPALLCAEDDDFRRVVTRVRHDLATIANQPANQRDPVRFEEQVAAHIAPFNHVGLCDARAHNMYRYTAAPR